MQGYNRESNDQMPPAEKKRPMPCSWPTGRPLPRPGTWTLQMPRDSRQQRLQRLPTFSKLNTMCTLRRLLIFHAKLFTRKLCATPQTCLQRYISRRQRTGCATLCTNVAHCRFCDRPRRTCPLQILQARPALRPLRKKCPQESLQRR